MQDKNTKMNLAELQVTVVEAYRQQLAAHLPDVEILDVFATNGIIEVKLNDAAIRDLATSHRVVKLAIEVEDKFNVTLLPCMVPLQD
jgi:hypothetical protein